MADEISTQADIDALLASIQSGDVDLEASSEDEIMNKVAKYKLKVEKE